MPIKKNRSKLSNINNEIKTVVPESPDIPEEKVIAVMLANYATKCADLSGLSDEDRKKKEHNLQHATKILADALGAKGLLQNMLVMQLLGVHELQQKLLAYASRSLNYPEDNQYFVNAISKLSHLYCTQVTLLQKLQGQSQQKVVVEHLHINKGAQAIVGQVNAHTKGGGL